MAIISPTINLVARPNGVLPPDLFTISNNGTNPAQYSIGPVNRMIKNIYGYPREDYDITTGDFNGYLLECVSSNLIGLNYAGRQLNATGWSNNGNGVMNTFSGYGITDPDYSSGTNTATRISANGSAIYIFTFSSFVTYAEKYTVSAYVRCANVNNTSTITFGIDNVYGTTKTISSKNWTRVFSGITPTALNNSAQLKIKVTGDPIFIDYIQVEKGNMSSAIPNNATPNVLGTRGDDILSNVTPNPFGTKINPNKGTFYMMYKHSDNTDKIPNAKYGVFEAYYNPTNAIVVATVNSSGAVPGTALYLRGFNSSMNSKLVDIPGQPTWHKIAVTYETDGYPKVAINGIVTTLSSIGTCQTLGTEAVPPDLHIGRITGLSVTAQTVAGYSYSASGFETYKTLDGHLKHFAYFPSALSDDDLISLTTL